MIIVKIKVQVNIGQGQEQGKWFEKHKFMSDQEGLILRTGVRKKLIKGKDINFKIKIQVI